MARVSSLGGKGAGQGEPDDVRGNRMHTISICAWRYAEYTLISGAPSGAHSASRVPSLTVSAVGELGDYGPLAERARTGRSTHISRVREACSRHPRILVT
jgi:hypothetical protein